MFLPCRSPDPAGIPRPGASAAPVLHECHHVAAPAATIRRNKVAHSPIAAAGGLPGSTVDLMASGTEHLAPGLHGYLVGHSTPPMPCCGT
jgi:hypothetical protein